MMQVISAVDMDDTQWITSNETKREKLIKVEAMQQKFLDVDANMVKHFIDILIGNMSKLATTNLKDDLP